MKIAVVLHLEGGRPEWPSLKSGEKIIWGKCARVTFTPARGGRLARVDILYGGRVPTAEVNATVYEILGGLGGTR